MKFRNLGEVVLVDGPDGSPKILHRASDRVTAEGLVTYLQGIGDDTPIHDPEMVEIYNKAQALSTQTDQVDEFFQGEVDNTPLHINPMKEYQMTMTEPTQMQPAQADVVSLGGRRIHVTYGRTVRPADYESKRVEATIEVDLPPGATAEQVEAILARETSVAASHVLQTLDLPFTYDEATQRVMEVFPAATVVASPAAPAQPALAPSQPLQAPPPMAQPAAPVAAAPSGWDALWAEFSTGARDNQGHLVSFYDNRISKTGNQPDFNPKKAGPDGKKQGLWIQSSFPGGGAPEHMVPALMDLVNYPAPPPRG